MVYSCENGAVLPDCRFVSQDCVNHIFVKFTSIVSVINFVAYVSSYFAVAKVIPCRRKRERLGLFGERDS